jgi:hypothetical protein
MRNYSSTRACQVAISKDEKTFSDIYIDSLLSLFAREYYQPSIRKKTTLAFSILPAPVRGRQ